MMSWNRYRSRKGIGIAFGHGKLDVYRAAIEYVGCVNTKLGQRGHAVHEETEEYRTNQIDPDTDADPDPEI